MTYNSYEKSGFCRKEGRRERMEEKKRSMEGTIGIRCVKMFWHHK